jgi:2-keto-4-pentenoate hydratase/2-oxohepta-3-ene-1,7-dioic acid hydratase in catechol pathway
MRFASFNRGAGPEVGAVLAEDRLVLPLSDGPLAFKGDMSQFIDSYEEGSTAAIGQGPALKLDDIQLLAPIPNPRRNIFCVGKNYREHAAEFSRSGFDSSGTMVPEVPIIFTKSSGSVVGPSADISSHRELTASLDYEAELGVVIGRGGRGISREQALDHVWGYTIINDVTARDLQKLHQQWFIGKSLDTFCPMGPWAVTSDQLDAQQLQITCQVNGELRQNANTADMIFDIRDLIHVISNGITLRPGDIIATGTPAGVGAGFTPPRFLKPGDVVSISIEHIGTLTNRVV